MRLLYVCSDWGIPPDGTKGAAIHLRAITKALADLGHEVLLLSPKGAPGNGHPARALLSERCELAEDSARMLRNWLGERNLTQGIGREIRPLIFNPWALDRSLHALRDQPPAVIIERLSLFGHLGLDLADALNVPLILEVNAPLTDEASSFRSLQLQTLAAQIEQRVLDRADRIGVVSQQLADRLVRNGVKATKTKVIFNGVDPSEFQSVEPRGSVRRRLGLDGGLVIGFAGSLKPWHGVNVLVEAFATLAKRDVHARLLIVGTGPSGDELKAEVARRRLAERVIFTGAVPHDQVPALLGAMDIAVAPFLAGDDFYFSPIKLFEYMASGTCVIASRVGQMAEVVDDGVDGLLCAPGDASDLFAKIETARSSPKARNTMGERARAKVLARYTWERAARQLESIIDAELGNRATPESRKSLIASAIG